ncbi:MAG: penicillin acylase family protein [Pirellulaceae bacterium]|nr:penicillin acylase family protein [Planctomycetales bacterium]
MSRVSIPNARRKFTAIRDDAGVPHIKGVTWLDVMYGLGYMHGLDRGTQLLFARAVASGRAAEQIADKPELLETDQFFRRIGLHLELPAEVEQLNAEVGTPIAVYCEGVNDGIAGRGRSLPMWATGFKPDSWDAASVILIGRLLSFGGLAVSQMQNERLLVELIHAGASDAALNELLGTRLDGVEFDIIRKANISNQLSDDALDLLVDLPRLAGSNAWAVSPSRSESGHALLASDPHLEVNRLPAIWYEAVLQWGERFIMGATLPGGPLFAVARTERLAWGVTYMKGDTIDYFVEDCRAGGSTGWQYRRESSWYDFHVRKESVARKGDAAQELRIYENDQGTIETSLDDASAGYYLSVAWAGRKCGSAKAISTWLNMVDANNVSEGMRVARECPQPTLCFVMADVEGHIGMQGCGSFPKRSKPTAGLVPLAAWDPKNHWQGWLSKDVLPSKYDPPEGFLATANEEQNQPGRPLLVTQPVHDYRLARIRERLQELPAARIEDMQTLQYDLVSVQARELLEVFLPHLPDGDLKRRLAMWDYYYGADDTTAPLFQRLYRNVMVELLGHDRGIGWRRMVYLCSRVGYSNMILTAADRLLMKDHSWWWHGRDKGELIRRAAELVDASSEKPWSEVNNFHFTDRFFGSHRVGRLLGFNSRRQAMPGCHATPFQGHVFQTATREQTFAPSYHFVTDMGTTEAWTNLPGGPSESRFSPYYRSDIERWIAGRYKQLTLSQ